MFSLVENHFKAVDTLKNDSNAQLRTSIVPQFIVNNVIRQIGSNPLVLKSELFKRNNDKKLTFKLVAQLVLKTLRLQRQVMSKKERKTIKQSHEFQEKISIYQNEITKLAPKVEGRIICL